jgi:hypothetical protein
VITTSPPKIEVIETVEHGVTIHVMPAAVAGNGLLMQIHQGGKITGRAYIPWHRVAALEAAIHRLRDENE